LRSQLQNLKKVHSEYEDKKGQELEFLIKENEQIRVKDRENKSRLILLERDLDVFREENRKL